MHALLPLMRGESDHGLARTKKGWKRIKMKWREQKRDWQVRGTNKKGLLLLCLSQIERGESLKTQMFLKKGAQSAHFLMELCRTWYCNELELCRTWYSMNCV